MNASNRQGAILVIGNDAQLRYLLQRYIERGGYEMTTRQALPSAEETGALSLAAIVFLSLDLLETSQELVGQLATRDIPIVACTGSVEEVRARELGADYCLLHPVTYLDFQTALGLLTSPKQG